MSMLWQRFTERAKRVVITAQEEAALAGDRFVKPEHLLVTLVKENDSVATKVLERLGVSPSGVRDSLTELIERNGGGRLNTTDITLDPRTKRTLDYGYDEARRTQTNYIGTEHLLLGIIREGDGAAYHTLAKLGVDIVSARKEVFTYLGGDATVPATRRQAFAGYAVGKFTDPDEATAWLNQMAQQHFQFSNAATSEGALWLIVRGIIEEDVEPAEGTGETGKGDA